MKRMISKILELIGNLIDIAIITIVTGVPLGGMLFFMFA